MNTSPFIWLYPQDRSPSQTWEAFWQGAPSNIPILLQPFVPQGSGSPRGPQFDSLSGQILQGPAVAVVNNLAAFMPASLGGQLIVLLPVIRDDGGQIFPYRYRILFRPRTLLEYQASLGSLQVKPWHRFETPDGSTIQQVWLSDDVDLLPTLPVIENIDIGGEVLRYGNQLYYPAQQRTCYGDELVVAVVPGEQEFDEPPVRTWDFAGADAEFAVAYGRPRTPVLVSSRDPS